jgi:hypothetical protein
MTPPPRRLLVLLVAIFVCALTVRVAATAVLQGLSSPPKREANSDQYDYELFAAQMAAGHGYSFAPGVPTASRPPGTSFVLYPLYALIGHSYLAGRILFCVLSAATCVLAWWAAYPVFGHRVGVLAAAIVAAYPGHFYYAMHFLSETPTAFALALACGLSVRSGTRAPGARDALSGAAWGFAVLTRPNFVLALGFVALAQARRTVGWRSRVLRIALLGVGSAVVVVPWVVRNQVVFGKPTVCTVVGGFTFWGANNRAAYEDPANVGYWMTTSDLQTPQELLVGSEVEREAAAWEYGKRYAREHADQLPRIVLHRVGRVVFAYSESSNRVADLALRVSWLLLLPFVAVGLWRARGVAGSAEFAAPLLATLATAVVFYGCGRFRDACAPQLAVFAAVGMLTLWKRGEPRP